MALLTDPAKELVAVFEQFTSNVDKRGDEYLAEKFSVAPWSTEFFQIIFSITDRCDFVSVLIDSIEIDDDFKQEAKSHIHLLKRGFSREALSQTWTTNHHDAGPRFINRGNIQPLKMLSGYLRRLAPYPSLTGEEIEELLKDVNELEGWLLEQQLVEHDFIRQAILEGLKHFRFRLERLEWLGWGYTVESLKEVIGAYYALHSTIPGDHSAPVAEGVLRKVEVLVRKVYEKASTTKDVVETGEFMLKAYGAYSIILPGGISGLLGGP